MKKTDPALVEKIREHAHLYPEDTLRQIAITYGLSEISVKRFCAGIKRSKSQSKNGRSKTLGNRLWSQVDRREPSQCWPWRGCRTSDGYGYIHAGERSMPVHRIAFEEMRGPIPDRMELDHLCKNRACCNPDHLEPVTRRENMVRAGIVPAAIHNAIDTRVSHIDTRQSIDTADFSLKGINEHTRSPHINTDCIKALNMDTSLPLIPVSIANPSGTAAPETPLAKRSPVVSTPRPCRADPFSTICTMQAPPELEPVTAPERYESASGTKEDIGVADWAETEYGDYWWRQTDDHLRDHTVWAQTDAMRETGEFLYWYQVNSTVDGNSPTTMSARSGPEACIKVERAFGKGWAHSWKYLRPDPHRGPFFHHRIVLANGIHIGTVARTPNDAISMVEAIWGPGQVLYAERLDRVSDGRLCWWMKNWREYLTTIHGKLELRKVGNG